MADSFSAQTTQVPPLTVDGVSGGTRSTLGNVGVCLSGGGSRACTAGMGSLRALKHLQVNGDSVLGQVKAISTVSGGSWLGVTFTYLPDNVSDEAFLNSYVADPGKLVLSNGRDVAVSLDQLPKGNIGEELACRRFSIPSLAVQAYMLWRRYGTPADMLWQTLMGTHLLESYGLHQCGENCLPTTFFTADTQTLEKIRGQNPALANTSGHVVASGSGKTSRPYLICNTAMFVNTPHDEAQTALVPVQATPYFTGVVSTPDGTDPNNRLVGGGGVTSFAFASTLTNVDANVVQIHQDRQWSITDIVGCSSAAFAAELEQLLTSPDKLLDQIDVYFDEAVDWLKQMVGSSPFLNLSKRIPNFLKKSLFKLLMRRFDAGVIIPEYNYWPVRDASPEPRAAPSRFADGGNLENTGICGMLSYHDIDSIIAFVNSQTPMTAGTHGVKDRHGDEVPGTKVIIDGQIPPLFGYQPYDADRGYVLFPERSEDYFSRSRVFAPEKFAELLKGLWQVSGNAAAPGSNTAPATFKQALVTEQNDWFAVSGQRPITVVWCYLNRVMDWEAKLSDEVRNEVNMTANFPNYRTFDTNLPATQINLLSSLTAWCVAAPENADTFTALFE